MYNKKITFFCYPQNPISIQKKLQTIQEKNPAQAESTFSPDLSFNFWAVPSHIF